MRTNCDNCGAVLVNGKCGYCGTVWENHIGSLVGENGYIGNIESTRHTLYKHSGRSLDGRMFNGGTIDVWSVNLSIIGLTTQEVSDLIERVTGRPL